MIPLGDGSRRPINFPITTLAIIAVNAFMFVLELLNDDAFIDRWSLVFYPLHALDGAPLIAKALHG